jgi:hypothetical protein
MSNFTFPLDFQIENYKYSKFKQNYLSIYPKDILNKIISLLNYEDSYNINLLDRYLNSEYPKKYLQSISQIHQPHGIVCNHYENKL